MKLFILFLLFIVLTNCEQYYRDYYKEQVIYANITKTIDLGSYMCIDVIVKADRLINAYFLKDNVIIKNCLNQFECNFSDGNWLEHEFQMMIESDVNKDDYYPIYYNSGKSLCIETVTYILLIMILTPIIIVCFIVGITFVLFLMKEQKYKVSNNTIKDGDMTYVAADE